MHGDTDALANHMVVNYMGALRQALLDLSDWVERGIEPLPSTAYTYREDGQIYPETDILKRFGVQSVIRVTSGGKKRVTVKAGQPVRLDIDVQVPVGAGEVTGIRMAKQSGTEILPENPFPVEVPFQRYVRDGVHGAEAHIEVSYDKPGTYFASIRCQSNRNGDAADIYGQVLNLDRIRIVVE